ncbi:cytochrome p450 [Fusarium longipes]|uniref:Cytochrome p450 n=1 Tax=Fusarium longipes TaxID=694270 RepID=A0A395T519_9HYPO|nr:cytochrome p450 [Fusarium longipes]
MATENGYFREDASDILYIYQEIWYGSVVRVAPNSLMISDATLWRRICAVRSPYVRADWYRGMRFEPDKDIILTYKSDKHMEMRTKMTAGYAGKESENLERTLNARITELLRLIKNTYISDDQSYKPFDWGLMSSNLTLDVVTELGFSHCIGNIESNSDVFDYYGSIAEGLPIIQALTIFPWIVTMFENSSILRRIMPSTEDKVGYGRLLGFAKKRARERFGPAKIEKRDMLGSLIRHGISQKEAEAETIVQMMAGTDPAATALRVAIMYITTQPQVHKRLLNEFESYGLLTKPPIEEIIPAAKASKMPYLQACIKESLRICPPFCGLLEKVVPPGGDVLEDGRVLPEGTHIGLSFWGMMRDPKVFGDDADVFRPERWFHTDEEKLRVMERSVECVFSAGRFTCLGKDLAILQVNKVIVEDSSIFQMEFPCRLLDQGSYDYKGSDSPNAQQIKPLSVIEAEFQLSDDLYDMGNLVGGPNGSKLSSQYQEILFSLIPTAAASQGSSRIALEHDQDRTRAWLEERVPNFDPPVTDMLSGIPSDLGLRISKPPQKCEESKSAVFQARASVAANPMISRVDLYRKLLDTYESEKARWVQYKNDARPRGDAKQQELDAYDSELPDNIIDHRVRTYVSYIDEESASEMLQQAKENLRACVQRNIDDSEDIYPVVMSPANWASYLSTDFQPIDLLSNPQTMAQTLLDTEKALAILQAKQRQLLGNDQDVAKLNAALQTAQSQYEDANAAMSSGLLDTAVDVIKLYFKAVLTGLTADENPIAAINGLTSSLSSVNDVLTQSNLPHLTPTAWSQLCTQQQNVMMKQNQLKIAQINYSRAQISAAEAAASDKKTELYSINNQIITKQMDIEYYHNMLQQVQNPMSMPITIPGPPGPETEQLTAQDIASAAVPGSPTSLNVPSVLGGASVWQTITLQAQSGSTEDEAMVKINVDDHPSSSGCLFWSHTTATTTTTGNSADEHDTTNTDIQVGFNVMKVEIQRPWMNASLLSQSQQFYRTAETPIAAYDTKVVTTALHNFQDFDKEEGGPGLLPSFPTSFIVAKDVHIIYTSNKGFSDAFKKDIESNASSGGGFLCFQSSSSSHGPGVQVEKMSVSTSSNAISIKIPAPQILGWISELVGKDDTQKQYPQLPADEFVDAAADS